MYSDKIKQQSDMLVLAVIYRRHYYLWIQHDKYRCPAKTAFYNAVGSKRILLADTS